MKRRTKPTKKECNILKVSHLKRPQNFLRTKEEKQNTKRRMSANGSRRTSSKDNTKGKQ